MTSNQNFNGPTLVQLGRSHSQEDPNVVIRLRRNTTSQPWGFRMLGGRDHGTCLYIQKVNSRSIAERRGLREGDGIMCIAGVTAEHLTHDQAKMEILRAGNELDLYIRRNVVAVHSETVVRQRSIDESRGEIVEEPSEMSFGYVNPNVQSRSFKILQAALYTEAPEEDRVRVYPGNVHPGNVHPANVHPLRTIPQGELMSMQDLLNL